ncbi:Cof-type HAD-IIB family hydrolase [Streptomyces sp. B1866]|uniref:HAD family hydrolase n=1 Tax=Streptomyces sp. B1866 TaxID=3075431 RepID=UPI00288F3481|nr:Cof-type HAD-IIB family hydrolase [Streptomyces sp. B1866]MDT3398899.1 Cof-type HAD-IIB family hydrolase [Streptomyces sp. B1866]
MHSDHSAASAPVTPPVPRPRSAPPRHRLVATDLDGTLLRGDLTVSARTLDALARAGRSGARHLVVTGRPAASCREFLVAMGYRGLAVCGQGAQLYDFDADRLLMTAALDRDLARAVVKRTEEELDSETPLELGVVTAAPANRFVITRAFAPRTRPGWRVVEDREELWAEPIEKVLLRHPGLPDGQVAAAAERAGGDEVSVTHSEKGMIEVLPAGTDKGVGLRRAADLLGCAPWETVAFGDMPNDIPMLTWSGYGVAMGNAHPRLVAVADEVAPGNEEDGVAAVLERLFPGATR